MYPPIAKAAHVTGNVTLRATVKDGQVVKTDVLFKLDPSGQRFLETSTVENLKTWHFAADVNVVFTVTCTYAIPARRPKNRRMPGSLSFPLWTFKSRFVLQSRQ